MPDNKIYMGIEIGGTKLQLVTGTRDGELLTAHRFQIRKEDGAKGIQEIIEKTVKENYKKKVAAAGIGFGGPVNWQTGKIATSFHISGWSDFNLIEWLEPVVGAPVFIDNDANVAALGEAVHGSGKDYRVVLYITIGSGVGGGLVVNRQIYHGAIPGEVEIGHIRLDRSGNTLQSLCSGWAVDEQIRSLISKEPGSLLARLVGDKTSGEAIFLKAALEQADASAWKLFEEITDNLAFGLSHAVHLFHPEIVILGGGFSLLGKILEQKVQTKIVDHLMETFQPGPLIRLANLEERAVPVGALLLAFQNICKTKND
jgi:glucokinase